MCIGCRRVSLWVEWRAGANEAENERAGRTPQATPLLRGSAVARALSSSAAQGKHARALAPPSPRNSVSMRSP